MLSDHAGWPRKRQSMAPGAHSATVTQQQLTPESPYGTYFVQYTVRCARALVGADLHPSSGHGANGKSLEFDSSTV